MEPVEAPHTILTYPPCPACKLNSGVMKGKYKEPWFCTYCKQGFDIDKETRVSEQRALTVAQQDTSILAEFSPDYIKHQLAKVVNLMDDVLQRGDDGNGDYGVIPGTKKPTLFKPGAEKLCMMFRLAPRYKIEREYDGNHLTVTAICELYHIPTDALMGSGIGLCSSKESKYAYRQQNRVCPKCHAEAIIKGKAEYGGGWVCFDKKGGCKAKFKDGDAAIEGQKSGRVPNEDIADQHNTVVKMACKRAYLDATLKATAASSIFTQDQDDSDEIRELREVRSEPEPPPPAHPEEQRSGPSAPVTQGAAAPPSGKPEMPFDPQEGEKGITTPIWNKCVEKLDACQTTKALKTAFDESLSAIENEATELQIETLRAYANKLREWIKGGK